MKTVIIWETADIEPGRRVEFKSGIEGRIISEHNPPRDDSSGIMMQRYAVRYSDECITHFQTPAELAAWLTQEGCASP